MGRSKNEKPATVAQEAFGDNDVKMEDPIVGNTEKREKKGKKDRKGKKERKDKKEKKTKKIESESNGGAAGVEPGQGAEEAASQEAAEDTSAPSKKRKRDPTVEEIEIDISAPEPPSRKALRKLKKSGATAATTAPTAVVSTAPKSENFSEHASQSRSKWGIWIGNIAFSAAKPDLETFFTRPPSTIPRIGITRINLPTNPQTRRNKGFAYVDFSSEESLDYALSLTETLWNGRPVLIKNSKDFSTRTSAPAVKLGADLSKNPPSKILWVGNLDFSTKEEDLSKHFAFAGEIAKVRLTTFEDTGKCKGFGFVDFKDEGSVRRAMLGLSPKDEAKLETLEGKEEEELGRLRKKRGLIGSRKVKMEYGEDSSVRYKKRFGKEKDTLGNDENAVQGAPIALMGSRGRLPTATGGVTELNTRKLLKRKFDKRLSNPGAAYSNDSRRTGAIAESKGKRVKFD